MATRWLAAGWILGAFCFAGCGGPAAPPPAAADRAAAQPLFDGLGNHRRPVTTSSPQAQQYFDQGLAFLFAFNHDEAIRSFQQAASLDPGCAMAQWGIAVANGPHINNPTLSEDRARAGWQAAREARRLAGTATEVERALIDAVAQRYADPPPADRAPLDAAYARAMAEVWHAHPGDADVGALYAEALMDLHPWDLWTHEGTPKPWTGEIVALLEAILVSHPSHPQANHLYIHAVEASPQPEKADAAADRLRDLQPGLGHMVHMPSHIDVRRGRWQQAIDANAKAMAADRAYLERSGKPQGFYRIYMAHNHHMLAFAAMMQGESARAVEVIRQLTDAIPEAWLRDNAAFADGYMAMPLEVDLRFGRWDEILAAPEPAADLPIARALRRYARGVAHAAKGEVEPARAEQRAFLEARAAVPAEAFFGNNTAADLLAVAEALLDGEILVRDGKTEAGLEALRRAVDLEDRLRYDEPPDWIHPVRHALGAALLQAGKAQEAERVYREDLAKLPENGWSLFGLARSLRLQGKDDEAASMEARFTRAWEKADVKVTSSCFCQPGA